MIDRTVIALVALCALPIAGVPCAHAAAAATASVASSQTAALPAATPHFDVGEYRVLGNTLLSNRQIEGVLYARLGPGKTFADVEKARKALEDAYHALGYGTVFVDIPPQVVDSGVVRLHVTEGRLDQRTVSGARYFSEQQILSGLPGTQPGSVPNLIDLQRELNTLNTQTPDRAVVPVLKAGPVPGTMDLNLQVSDRLPLHGSLEINNQYTPDTEPLRVTGSLNYSNLFADLDSVAIQYTTAPQKPSEVGVFNIGYAFHPVGQGIRPSLSFTNSSSDVATLGTLGVLGKGQMIGGRLNLPLLQQPGDLQSVTLGLDYKHFHNTISLLSTPAVIEPISYLNLSATYAGVWQSVTPSGSLRRSGSLDVMADVGPRGFANSAVDFDNNRYLGRGNYAYLHADGSFTQPLPGRLLLVLRATGQAALEPLVVYEQQSFTGADGVRGYLEAEVLGDTGIKGTVQVQSLPIAHKGSQWGDAFVFFDAAHSHTIDALPGEPGVTMLRSWGAGLDVLPGHRVTGALTVADPLLPGPRTPAHDWHVLFDLKGIF